MLQALSPEPPAPLWLDIVKTIIGPLIAAIVVIVGLIWRDRIERRNVAQAWFEQRYITEGLDVLMSHLAALHNGTIEPRRIIFSETTLSVPSDLRWRLLSIIPGFSFLLGGEIVESIVLSAMRSDHPVVLTPDEARELYDYLGELLMFAEDIRIAVLDVRINHKRDVYAINKRPTLVAVVEQWEKKFFNGEGIEAANRKLTEKFSKRVGEAAALLKRVKAHPSA